VQINFHFIPNSFASFFISSKEVTITLLDPCKALNSISAFSYQLRIGYNPSTKASFLPLLTITTPYGSLERFEIVPFIAFVVSSEPTISKAT